MADSEKKLRKVFVPVPTAHAPTRENLWAEIDSADTARINNIPFLTEAVAYQDLVRVDEAGQVLEVLERTTFTVHAVYKVATDPEAAEREYKAIGEHMRSANIVCESAMPGMMGMAVPLTVTNEQLLDLMKRSPVPLTLRDEIENGDADDGD